MKLITHSLMRSHRTCHRKRHFEYNLGYRSLIVPPALEFGNLAHELLECYWLTRQRGGNVTLALIEKFRAIRTSDPIDRIYLRVMICAYVCVWSKVECDVLAVEAEFKAPLANPKTGVVSDYWLRSGKIDLLIRLPNGVVTLVEHKTSSADVGPGSTYRRRLDMDEQVSYYVEGAKSIGFLPHAVIYDILKKPKHELKLATPEEDQIWTKITKKNPVSRLRKGQRLTDETMEDFLGRLAEDVGSNLDEWIVRVPLHRGSSQLNSYMTDVWNQSESMRIMDETNAHFPNSDACGGGYGSGFGCQFNDVCNGDADLENPLRFRLLKNVHPELAPKP
jgi:hypothetical protein